MNHNFASVACPHSILIDVYSTLLAFLFAATLVAVPAHTQTNSEVGSRIVNGVAYSHLYSSLDFATRVNACIADAEAGVATSHICDSTGESPRQIISHQIDIGNATNALVTWIHGGQCIWDIRMTGGKYYALYQYPRTRVYGANQQRNGCELNNESPDGGLAGFYTNSGNGYYQFGDFTFRETRGSLAGKGVVQINGAYDNSYYHDLTVLNYLPRTTGLFIGGAGPCCSLMLERISIGANDTGGTLVDVEGQGAHEAPGIWFFNSSFGHPANGTPLFLCHDSGLPYLTSIGFFGTYEEVTGRLANVPINQIDGCVSVFFHGITIEAVSMPASRTVAALSISHAFPTAIDVTNLNMSHGFPLPHPAIVQPHGETIFTDVAGNLASYTSNVAYADSIGLPIETPPSTTHCTPGTIVGTDANYIYVCTASGKIKRAALSTY